MTNPDGRGGIRNLLTGAGTSDSVARMTEDTISTDHFAKVSRKSNPKFPTAEARCFRRWDLYLTLGPCRPNGEVCLTFVSANGQSTLVRKKTVYLF